MYSKNWKIGITCSRQVVFQVLLTRKEIETQKAEKVITQDISIAHDIFLHKFFCHTVPSTQENSFFFLISPHKTFLNRWLTTNRKRKGNNTSSHHCCRFYSPVARDWKKENDTTFGSSSFTCNRTLFFFLHKSLILSSTSIAGETHLLCRNKNIKNKRTLFFCCNLS